MLQRSSSFRFILDGLGNCSVVSLYLQNPTEHENYKGSMHTFEITVLLNFMAAILDFSGSHFVSFLSGLLDNCSVVVLDPKKTYDWT